jgi:hypothetical protein
VILHGVGDQMQLVRDLARRHALADKRGYRSPDRSGRRHP